MSNYAAIHDLYDNFTPVMLALSDFARALRIEFFNWQNDVKFNEKKMNMYDSSINNILYNYVHGNLPDRAPVFEKIKYIDLILRLEFSISKDEDLRTHFTCQMINKKIVEQGLGSFEFTAAGERVLFKTAAVPIINQIRADREIVLFTHKPQKN
jgi:hypothetical protein